MITTWPASPTELNESDAMRLVVITGCLGSFVHIATSLTDFVGNHKFVASWTMWYIVRPLIGGGLALIVYLVIRGGLFTPSAISDGAFNIYGLLALSALTGMFSKQATDKLREVFDNIFRTSNEVKRLNPLSVKKPKILSLEPNFIPVNSKSLSVLIKGEEFTNESVVMIDNKVKDKSFLGKEELKITLTPDEVNEENTLSIKVVNDGIDDGESNIVSLKIVKESA